MVFFIHGDNYKSFQLARSIFSFHVEMLLLLGEPKASLVIKRSKHENWNALSQLKGWIKIPRDGTWLFKSKQSYMWKLIWLSLLVSNWPKIFFTTTKMIVMNISFVIAHNTLVLSIPFRCHICVIHDHDQGQNHYVAYKRALHPQLSLQLWHIQM